MKSKMRTRVPGPLRVSDRGNERWLLAGTASPDLRIHLKGVDAAAARSLAVGQVDSAELEWHAGYVRVYLWRAGTETTLAAATAVVQSAQPTLFEALPLARFDAAAQRFWRRVFRIVRLPGGRHFLGLLARRARVKD